MIHANKPQVRPESCFASGRDKDVTHARPAGARPVVDRLPPESIEKPEIPPAPCLNRTP